MSKKNIITVAILMVASITLISMVGCGKNNQNNTDINTTTLSATEESKTDVVDSGIATTNKNEIKEPETSEAVVEEDSTVGVTDNTTSATEESVTTAEEKVPATEITTLAPTKKGVIYKVSGDSKIWANTVGQAYILFKNIDTPNEWGEKGRVYELYVAQFGDDYSMWSDGYWSMDESERTLKLTPKNQSENGNVGVDAGKTKTITATNGVFVIDVTFSSGGKTTMKLKP